LVPINVEVIKTGSTPEPSGTMRIR